MRELPEHIQEIERRHKFEAAFYTINPSVMKNLSGNHLKANADREALLMEVGLMHVKLHTRDTKIKRQADAITHLEASRKGLRRERNDAMKIVQVGIEKFNQLRKQHDKLKAIKRDLERQILHDGGWWTRKMQSTETMLDEAHDMLFESFEDWSRALAERNEARDLARRFKKLSDNVLEELGWYFEATRQVKWVSEESDEAVVWDVLETLWKHHPEPEIRKLYKIEYERITGHAPEPTTE